MSTDRTLFATFKSHVSDHLGVSLSKIRRGGSANEYMRALHVDQLDSHQTYTLLDASDHVYIESMRHSSSLLIKGNNTTVTVKDIVHSLLYVEGQNITVLVLNSRGGTIHVVGDNALVLIDHSTAPTGINIEGVNGTVVSPYVSAECVNKNQVNFENVGNLTCFLVDSSRESILHVLYVNKSRIFSPTLHNIFEKITDSWSDHTIYLDHMPEWRQIQFDMLNVESKGLSAVETMKFSINLSFQEYAIHTEFEEQHGKLRTRLPILR